jgi:hypothetical protein
MKNSQIQTQVFVYILSIIVVSLILLYGYNAIKGFKERNEQIAMIELENRLKSEISSVSADYANIARGEFTLPAEYKAICFVDNYKLTFKQKVSCTGQTPDSATQAIINDAVKDETANIFLVPDGSKNFKIGNIAVDDADSPGGCICIPKKGAQVLARMEGLGNGVKISEW